MIICTAEQRTPEWFADRIGVATGSRAPDIVATIKSGEAAAYRDYRTQLVCEILTGKPLDEPITNADIQRGIDLEPKAQMEYESFTGFLVQNVGFVKHDTLRAGCSVDGMLDNWNGIIEIKCPRPALHILTLKGGVPTKHLPQITHNLYITNAEYCDFISYCPALPENLSLFVSRVMRDDLDIAAYEERLLRFLEEVETEVNFLKQWERK